MGSTAYPTAAKYLPQSQNLTALRAAAQECRGCPLYAGATQAVFSEGAKASQIVFVGEQPGDKEDLEGRPFVGPAGKYLRSELEQAGIPSKAIYLTNAVKHFKWTPRGKRRLHSKPTVREVVACRAWLESELTLVAPAMLITLGATAAQSLFGSDFKVTHRRGIPFKSEWANWTLATYHPSALLRAKSNSGGNEMEVEFRKDLLAVSREYRRQTAHSHSNTSSAKG